MELKDYIAPIRKWWWLITASVVIAVVSAYFATRELPEVYMARTTLLVGRALAQKNPDALEFGISRTLSYAYANVAMREPVANATMAKLGLTRLPEYFAAASTDGQFIEISVTDSSPELAQIVANELANQLIRQSPSGSGGLLDEERRAFVNAQLDDLQKKIENTKLEIQRKQEELATLTSSASIDNAQGEISALEERLDSLQVNFATLLSNTDDGAANTLTIFEPAALPIVAIGPQVYLIIAAAGLAGLVLSAGAAYLIEFLDDTIKTADDVTRLFPYPIIGYIGEMERGRNGLISVADRPRSALADAFRSLRTNLEFSSVDRALRTIQVTSAAPGDGKSSVAFNLALIIAQRGRRVLLLDCDLRKPTVHRMLGIPNHDGLSDLFLGKLNIQDVTRIWRDNKLVAITSGTPPPNPTELLGSKRMDQVLAELKEIYDVVIVDSPPFFVPDAWVLSSKVDAVLMVTQPGQTKRSVVRAMVDQAKRVNAPVAGVVVNRLSRSRAGDGRYSYLSTYYYGHDEVSGSRPGVAEPAPTKRLQFPSVLRLLQRGPQNGAANGRHAEADEPAAQNGHRVDVLPPAAPADTERSRVTLDLLYAMSRELASQMDLRELMQRILQMTLDSVGAGSGSMIVLNEENAPLEGVMIYEGKASVHTAEQLRDVVERGLAGWVIENRRPVKLDNTHEDPRWLRKDEAERSDEAPRSAISVPLMNNDRVVGVLTLVHPNVNHFTRDDLSMVTAIAVGVSFSNVYSE